MSPPWVVMSLPAVDDPRSMLPFALARNETPLVAPRVMFLLMAISPSAMSDNVLVVLVDVMLALTVMFPASAPPPVVETLTLVPAFNLPSMAVLEMFEPLAEGVHVVGVLASQLPPEDVVLLMVTLYGSNSHSPAFPLYAVASPCA